MLVEWDAIASDLSEIHGINVWDKRQMTGEGCWVELQSRIVGLLVRPFSHDAFGRPVFTSMLQARALARLKPPT